MSLDNPSITARASFTIRVIETGGNRTLKVEDGNHRGGGNVYTRPGRTVSWVNGTGTTCALSFRHLPDPDAEVPDGSPFWPFDEPMPAGCRKVLAGGEAWMPKLLPRLDVVVKYDVELPDRTDVPSLDPVIIVRP